MIRVDISEQFPVVVSLIDETTGTAAAGQTVYYEIRKDDDSSLSPHIGGVLPESAVEAGIYRKVQTIPTAGSYIIYSTCSGFTSGAEELIVNPESIYDVTKMDRQYNVSVEDVPRSTVSGTASQIVRNVPYGETDYIITRIKNDADPDWTGTVTSGIVYAHYRSITDTLPYLMGGPY